MFLLIIPIVLNYWLPVAEGQQCKNDLGQSVDWFYLYKLPAMSSNQNPNLQKGTAYVYLTSLNSTGDWKLSKKSIKDPTSALGRTLAPIYTNSSSDLLHLLYSNEPPFEQGHLLNGQAKGAVISNDKFGLWLVHSAPQFPMPPVSNKEMDTMFGKLNSFTRHAYSFPSMALKYGQTFFCVTVPSSQLTKMSYVFKYTKPRIYSSNMPESLERTLFNLATTAGTYERKMAWHQKTVIKSLKGEEFISYAKSKYFRKDFYADYVAPDLRSDLVVEGWTRGFTPMPLNCKTAQQILDVREINMEVQNESVHFKNSQDHSKWLLAASSNVTVVCIADVSRILAQYKYGGGAICHRNLNVWKRFMKIISKVQGCSAKTQSKNPKMSTDNKKKIPNKT